MLPQRATRYDTIIIGAGAMGSATAWQLAARGQRVLLIDRHHPPHDQGSSHGETRVIREAYFEHPSYVPLVQRAYELWQQLEAETSHKLLHITGGLMIGPNDGPVFDGALTSARVHHLAHEVLDASAVNTQFAACNVPPTMAAVLEPRAGMLFVESCIEAFHERAAALGVTILPDQPVLDWSASPNGVTVETAAGHHEANQLVIAAGAWLPQLVPELAARLTVERQVLHWFHAEADPDRFRPDRLPVSLWDYEPGAAFYALPNAGTGVKAALHHQGEATTPAGVRRTVSDEERLAMGRLLARFLPGLRPLPHHSVVCLYTNTPDGHFLVDRHPRHQQVLLLSPCSGHGFKFASVIGEVAADLVMNGKSGFDLTRFGLDRLLSDPSVA